MIAAVTADANSSSTIELKEDSRKKGAGGGVRREGVKEEFGAESGELWREKRREDITDKKIKIIQRFFFFKLQS